MSTTIKPTATTTETMYDVERTYTATRIASSNRRPDYEVRVDDMYVGIITRLGGRRFLIATGGGAPWVFIAPDHGRVADVMDYVARSFVNEMNA